MRRRSESTSPEPSERRTHAPPTAAPAVNSVVDDNVDDPSLNHYSLYFIPSPHSLLPHLPAHNLNSACLYVVNSGGLEQGLGLCFCLDLVVSPGTANGHSPGLGVARHQGCIARAPRIDEVHARWDLGRAVYLGWVEENILARLEAIILSVPVPGVSEGMTREWIMECASRLEMEGIVANADLMLRGCI